MATPDIQHEAQELEIIIDFIQNSMLDYGSLNQGLLAIEDKVIFDKYVTKFKDHEIDLNQVGYDYHDSLKLLEAFLALQKQYVEENALTPNADYIAIAHALETQKPSDSAKFQSVIFKNTTAKHILDHSRFAIALTASPKCNDAATLATWLGMDYAKNQSRIDNIFEAAQESKSLVAIKVDNQAEQSKVVISAHAEGNKSNPANALSKKRWKEEFEASPALVNMDGKKYLVKLHETADGRMVYVCKDKNNPSATYRGVTYAEAQQMQGQVIAYMQDVADALNYVCVTQNNQTITSSMELTGGAGAGEALDYSDTASSSDTDSEDSDDYDSTLSTLSEFTGGLPRATETEEATFKARVSALSTPPDKIGENLLELDEIHGRMKTLNSNALNPSNQKSAKKEIKKLIKESDDLRNNTQKLINKERKRTRGSQDDLQGYLNEVSSHLEFEEQKFEMLRTGSDYQTTKDEILKTVKSAESVIRNGSAAREDITKAKKDITQAEKALAKLERKHKALQKEGWDFINRIENKGAKAPASQKGAADMMGEMLGEIGKNFNDLVTRTQNMVTLIGNVSKTEQREAKQAKKTDKLVAYTSMALQNLNSDIEALNDAVGNFKKTYSEKDTSKGHHKAYVSDFKNLAHCYKVGIPHGERMLALARENLENVSGPQKERLKAEIDDAETRFKKAKDDVSGQLNKRSGMKEPATRSGTAAERASVVKTKNAFITKVEKNLELRSPSNDASDKKKGPASRP